MRKAAAIVALQVEEECLRCETFASTKVSDDSQC